jgi:hypothetical protein
MHRTLTQRKRVSNPQSSQASYSIAIINFQERDTNVIHNLCDELHRPSNTGNLLKHGAKTDLREEKSRIVNQNMTVCLQQN